MDNEKKQSQQEVIATLLEHRKLTVENVGLKVTRAMLLGKLTSDLSTLDDVTTIVGRATRACIIHTQLANIPDDGVLRTGDEWIDLAIQGVDMSSPEIRDMCVEEGMKIIDEAKEFSVATIKKMSAEE